MIEIKYYQACRGVKRMGNIFTLRPYNILEHQYIVGMLFRNFASKEDVPYDINVWDIVLNHDIIEAVTQDLPWPVKNFNPVTKEAWQTIENEILKSHPQLCKYSDEEMKKRLNERQHALMKACDTLDLFIFVKEEQKYGNCSKEILEVEQNCLRILEGLKFKFPKIQKFIENGKY